ncbi:MAG: hypothetical protein OEM52_10495 [bacterium]|nr:hypothetical protein [bacterium]
MPTEPNLQSITSPLTMPIRHCLVMSRPFGSKPRRFVLPGQPVALTPCRIPQEEWSVCYADECYLNDKCPSYAGNHPRFFKPTLPDVTGLGSDDDFTLLNIIDYL